VTASTKDTAAAVEQKRKELEAAEAEHAAAQDDQPPREAPLILADILDYASERFGHHARFAKLVAEYKATLPKEEPAPEDQPSK
jgi:hypothetical protein